MAVKLNNFVNVHITKDAPTSSRINRVVAYLSSSVKDDINNEQKIYYSLTEVSKASENGTTALYTEGSDVYEACRVFFNCGGQCIKLVPIAANLSNQSDTNALYKTAVSEFDSSIIAFACQEGKSTGAGTYNGGLDDTGKTELVAYLDGLEASEGTAYRKIMVTDINSLTEISSLGESTSLACKYCPTADKYTCMSILAYLSKINVEHPETLADYCFTKEITLEAQKSFTNSDWTTYGKKVNVVLDILGGTPTNFGGNTAGMTDLVEEYVIIMIAQEIAQVQLQLLQTKLSSQEAVTKIHSGLISVLEEYYNAGFLAETVYKGETISQVKGEENYTILTQDEVITGGYHIVILPLTSRTDAEIDERKLSDVHVILSTTKGIRYIQTTGKVI